ncbi:ribbon-helix-helix protein, CopG family [Leptolyngbya sp. 15MV]|nr:ribbon-helix-helix protein, CopG family [Leptolyngbya sp. 15MV]
MPRKAAPLRIESDFVRARVDEIARRTGMTETAIIEDALRAYVPPAAEQEVPAGLVRKGPLLVLQSRGRRISLADANAALDAARLRDP